MITDNLDLCYTLLMNEDRHIWQVWADKLHRWGLKDWTAAFLEAAGPLNVLGAQAIYLGQPLLNRALPEGHLEALASVLEDTELATTFAAFLREEIS